MTNFLKAATELGITECVMTRYDIGAVLQIVNADAGCDSIEQITVIEISDTVAADAGDQWSKTYAEREKEDPNYVCVSPIFNNPLDGLALVLKNIPGPIAFVLNDWLPGTRGYMLPADEFDYPLERELEIIAYRQSMSDHPSDVILIEGLSLYERGCALPIEGWKFSPYANSEFIERLFGATHDITRDKHGAGSVLLVPKQTGSANATFDDPKIFAEEDERSLSEQSSSDDRSSESAPQPQSI